MLDTFIRKLGYIKPSDIPPSEYFYLCLSQNLLYNNSMPTSTTQHIPDELIEHSLALCGKTMEDMNKITLHRPLIIKESFSIEKFAYYLLSEDFIDQYTQNTWGTTSEPDYAFEDMAERFGKALYQFQSGDAEPLILLLKKIP